MAVVQISKIQIRRGLKNTNSGVPQLSSAEFAWAVDTQELFIGNGSVAEGAPYVGNTKIITEHDNILELANSYRFGADQPSITETLERSLQSKIDEIQVSIIDFGAVNDGSTDCVDAFEKAFLDLFRNADQTLRKTLIIPNGEYLFASDLEVPSNVILKGETKNGVVLNIDRNNITFVTSEGQPVSAFTSSNRPRNIYFDNLTIQRSSGQLVISGVADSVFSNIVFKGEYQLGSPISNVLTESSAVFWNNNISGTKVNNIKFDKCDFVSNSISVKCNQSIETSTEIFFENCNFTVNDIGIYIIGTANQINNWKIRFSKFEEIATSAFISTAGIGTRIQGCSFNNVGNGTGTASFPSSSMVVFGDSRDNIVFDCFSNRLQNAVVISDASKSSVPEVFNSSLTKLNDRAYETIYLSDSFRPLAAISATNSFTIINYHLKLGPENGKYSRVGKITLSLGDDLAGSEDVTTVSLTDNYQFSPTFLTSEGASLMTNFEFTATLADNDDDSGIETIVLSYRNPLSSGSTGTISFDISYGV